MGLRIETGPHIKFLPFLYAKTYSATCSQPRRIY
jgi:hypothetical protein